MLNTYYDRSLKLWVAYYTDNLGQLGDAAYGVSKEEASFRLGIEFGRNPQDFARPLTSTSKPLNTHGGFGPHKEKQMDQEVETTEFRTERRGVRVSMADHDDGVWLHLSCDGAMFYVVLTKAEAEKTVKGLQNILEWLEAKS